VHRTPRPSISLLIVLIVAALAQEANAVPRYTARYRQNCTLCHVNPTGGGMRSLYATQYIVPAELSLLKPPEELVARIQPKLSESVTVGTDLRAAHFHATKRQPGRNFFEMQGEAYLQWSIDDKISANLDIDQISSVETYALAWVLPFHGYAKAGRFTPVFGWKVADHNTFVREELWFDQPFNTDAGVEIGFYPKHVALWASVLNGEPGANTLFDANDELAYVAGGLSHFGAGPVGVGLGGSFWHNRLDRAESSANPGRRTAGGPFGYLSWDRFTYLWEVDASRLVVPGTRVRTKLITSHELSYALRPGLDLVASYNWVDRNLDLQSGIKERFGVGVDVNPVPFVQLQAQLSVYRTSGQDPTQDPPDVPEPDFVRSEVQVHLFY
jgi:hypothetical protein